MASKACAKPNRNGRVVLGIVALAMTLVIAVTSSWVTVQVTLASTQATVEHHGEDLKEIKSDVKALSREVAEIKAILKDGSK